MPTNATQLYCPVCRETHICTALDTAQAKIQLHYKIERGRFFNKEYPDIQWFRRYRECGGCGSVFETAEVSEGLVDELSHLRRQLQRLRREVEELRAERTS